MKQTSPMQLISLPSWWHLIVSLYGDRTNTARVLWNSSMRWDIRQLLPTQANRRCSEIVQLEVYFSASYMCTHSQHVNLSSGSNKLLFVLQSAYVIPCRNEQNAEQEALQLVQQPPLTDMRQLLGFNTPRPAMADPALQTCGQVPRTALPAHIS